MDRRAQLLIGVTLVRHREEGEQPGVLVPRKAGESLGGRGDLLVAHQAAVKPRGAPVREDVLDGVIDRVIRVAVVRLVVALDIDRLGRILQGHRALAGLRRLDRRQLLGLGAAGNSAKVLLEHWHGIRRLHIADHGNDHVCRHIVFLVEGLRFGGRDVAQIALPADAGPLIRMRNVGRRKKLFDQPADRARVRAHPALFHDHVAFAIKLPRHRMRDPVALHVGPELQAIRRHAPEVLGGVEGSLRVQPGRAV